MDNVVKELTIASLPDCYYKEQLSKLVVDPATAKVFVVAVPGYANDWSAYIGWPDFDSILVLLRRGDGAYYSQFVRTPEQVAKSGDKLGRETAEQIFPEMKGLAYRD
jgi:hypothetical protein